MVDAAAPGIELPAGLTAPRARQVRDPADIDPADRQPLDEGAAQLPATLTAVSRLEVVPGLEQARVVAGHRHGHTCSLSQRPARAAAPRILANRPRAPSNNSRPCASYENRTGFPPSAG